MTPDNNESTPEETPQLTPDGSAGDAGDAQEKPAAPLNRAERRAQAKGKKGEAETGLLAGLRQNQVQGMRGKQSGGGSKKSFQRKV